MTYSVDFECLSETRSSFSTDTVVTQVDGGEYLEGVERVVLKTG